METEEAPPLPPSVLPSFRSELCPCVPAELQLQMVTIEAEFMKGRVRNGINFETYLARWDLIAHLAILPSGELIGFSISGTEQRGTKIFLYELHVHQDKRGRGIGTALMEMAERTARGGQPARSS